MTEYETCMAIKIIKDALNELDLKELRDEALMMLDKLIESKDKRFYKMLDEKNRLKDLNKLLSKPQCIYLNLSYDPHGNIPYCKVSKLGYCKGICSEYRG